MKIQIVRLVTVLAMLWLMLSGIFKSQLIILGCLSIALTTVIAIKMRVLKFQNQPINYQAINIMRYWVWLYIEIFKSSWNVIKATIRPSLPISPNLRVIQANPDTAVGRVLYANSITLTPGTTAIRYTNDKKVVVHGLHEGNLIELDEGNMANQIKKMESMFLPKALRKSH